MTLKYFITFILLVFILTGCQNESGEGMVHLQEELIPQFHEANVITTKDRSWSNGAGLTRSVHSPFQTIGVLEGDDVEMFGEVEGIVEDPDGRILILDSSNNEIRIFSNRGEYIDSFGRSGGGPGEFQFPEALSMSPGGRFIVAERNGRIQVFEPSAETYKRVGGFTVEFTPEDACIMDGNVYLQGFLAQHPEESIHVYTLDGDRDYSFGPVYRSEQTSVRERLSQGNIACDQATNTVAFAFTYGPVVYGYAPGGDLQWSSRIEPFDPVPIEQTGPTSLKYLSDPGTDMIQNLSDLPGPRVLVQRERQRSQESDELSHSYWISNQDGTGGYIGDLTGPVHFANHERLLAGSNAPFPKVDIYSVGEVMWEEKIDQAEAE